MYTNMDTNWLVGMHNGYQRLAAEPVVTPTKEVPPLIGEHPARDILRAAAHIRERVSREADPPLSFVKFMKGTHPRSLLGVMPKMQAWLRAAIPITAARVPAVRKWLTLAANAVGETRRRTLSEDPATRLAASVALPMDEQIYLALAGVAAHFAAAESGETAILCETYDWIASGFHEIHEKDLTTEEFPIIQRYHQKHREYQSKIAGVGVRLGASLDIPRQEMLWTMFKTVEVYVNGSIVNYYEKAGEILRVRNDITQLNATIIKMKKITAPIPIEVIKLLRANRDFFFPKNQTNVEEACLSFTAILVSLKQSATKHRAGKKTLTWITSVIERGMHLCALARALPVSRLLKSGIDMMLMNTGQQSLRFLITKKSLGYFYQQHQFKQVTQFPPTIPTSLFRIPAAERDISDALFSYIKLLSVGLQRDLELHIVASPSGNIHIGDNVAKKMTTDEHMRGSADALRELVTMSPVQLQQAIGTNIRLMMHPTSTARIKSVLMTEVERYLMAKSKNKDVREWIDERGTISKSLRLPVMSDRMALDLWGGAEPLRKYLVTKTPSRQEAGAALYVLRIRPTFYIGVESWQNVLSRHAIAKFGGIWALDERVGLLERRIGVIERRAAACSASNESVDLLVKSSIIHDFDADRGRLYRSIAAHGTNVGNACGRIARRT